MMGAGSTAHADVPTVTETAKLVPTDSMAQDQVGKSVAIEDETLVLGAPNYFADPNGPSSLYVFVCGEAGQWEQFDRLYAEAADGHGRIMALSLHAWVSGQAFRIGPQDQMITLPFTQQRPDTGEPFEIQAIGVIVDQPERRTYSSVALRPSDSMTVDTEASPRFRWVSMTWRMVWRSDGNTRRSGGRPRSP